jgi:DNA-directed RNA polymerase subunit RPC12/RpoP
MTRLCMDCHGELEYGRAYSGVCPSCRAKRANKSRREREKAAGRSTGRRKECEW